MPKRIVVPEGMLKAAIQADKELYEHWGPIPEDRWGRTTRKAIIEHSVNAALLWLSENPIRPNCEQIGEISKWFGSHNHGATCEDFCEEWQRRMFLAPEPEVPEEIADLTIADSDDIAGDLHNARLIEAYRRGQRSMSTHSYEWSSEPKSAD